MTLRLLGGLLLLVSCGRQVNIDHSSLINASKQESNALTISSFKEGSISKMENSNSYLEYNQNSYSISEESSHLSKRFIDGLPKGVTGVKFKGRILKGAISISEIEKRDP